MKAIKFYYRHVKYRKSEKHPHFHILQLMAADMFGCIPFLIFKAPTVRWCCVCVFVSAFTLTLKLFSCFPGIGCCFFRRKVPRLACRRVI